MPLFQGVHNFSFKGHATSQKGDATFNKVLNISRIHLKVYNNNVESHQTYCKNYDKTEAKLAFFLENVQFVTLNSICKGAAVKLKNFKGDGEVPVLYTLSNSFLYKTLNQILEKMIPAGIPQYLVKFHESNLFGTFVASVASGPSVLTIEDLAHGFVLWLGACGVSFIAFFLELMWFRLIIWFGKFIRLWKLLKFLKFKIIN